VTATASTTAVIVGASSGLGRALAADLARRGHALLLVASDARDLQAIAADLELRFDADVATLALDLAREPGPGARILASLVSMPPLSALLLAAGVSCDDDDFSLSAARIGELLSINLHAPHAIVHALLPTLREARGTIVLFGSIAAVAAAAATSSTPAPSARSIRFTKACARRMHRARRMCSCIASASSPPTSPTA
jgi:short-subunit dehydrogenase